MVNRKQKIKTVEVKQNGFTIIEMIVVIAVFLLIIGAAINIFLSIIQNQRRLLAQQQLLNQVSYMEEYMSKALRMAKTEFNEGCLIDAQGTDHRGSIYILTRYDTNSQIYRGIKFLNQSNLDSLGNPVCQEFFLDNVTPDGASPLIFNDPNNPLVLKELKSWNGSSVSDSYAVALTSSNIQLNSIKFVINGLSGSTGASELDHIQPRVTILLNVNASGDSKSSAKTIQTTVSQRNLNVE